MNWYRKFKAGLFTKSQFLVGVALTMFATSAVIYAANVLIGFKTFTAGQTISAADVNSNFDKLHQAIANIGQRFHIGMSTSPTAFPSTNASTLNSLPAVDFDLINYDYTEGELGKALVNANSTTLPAGLYEATFIGRVASPTSAFGTFYLFKGSTTIMNVYISTNTNNNSVKFYLDSPAVIRVRAKASQYGTAPNLYLDPAKTRLFIQKL